MPIIQWAEETGTATDWAGTIKGYFVNENITWESTFQFNGVLTFAV
jgi:hypothetical protein